jgi:cullin-associated NEDD8-dissociated protein 1
MGFESFVQKCPTQVEPHLDKIVQAALAYMSYDPNYSYGIEDNEEKNGMDEDGSDGSDYGYDDDDDGDGGYEDDGDDDFYDDDDDDESWKVRRSAIRSLLAVVETKKHNPGFLWSKSYVVRRKKTVDCVASALVGRFKEREENCRVGILETFTKLLQVTTTEITSNHNTSNLKFSCNGNDDNNNDDIKMDDDDDDDAVATDGTSDDETIITIVDLHGKYAPAIVKGCEKLMGIKKGNERSKSYALSLLSTLCMAPGGVGGKDEILSVFKHVQAFLGDGNDDDNDKDNAVGGGNHHRAETTSKALRLDALSLIVAMLESNNHNPNHIREGLSSALLPQLCNATKEHWYKVIAEALRALAAVPKFFSGTTTGTNKETTDIAIRLYDSIEPLLAAHDVDQEIKECALLATSSLLSELHTNLQKQHISRLSELLLERLTNETTRIPAIKTFSSICSSKNGREIDFAGTGNKKGILGDSITTMSGFLKMQSRSLRQTSLEALDVVITNHGSTIKPKKVATELYSSLLEELADLVIDTDLHISHLSLYV